MTLFVRLLPLYQKKGVLPFPSDNLEMGFPVLNIEIVNGRKISTFYRVSVTF